MMRRIAVALGIDLVFTLVFVLTGRGSHNEDATLGGLLITWWPFVVALLIGWMVTVAWKRPFGVLHPGVGIWLVTVAGGMTLRALSGQGTAVPFIIVATISLAVLLVGWRGIAALVRRRRSARATVSPESGRYS